MGKAKPLNDHLERDARERPPYYSVALLHSFIEANFLIDEKERPDPPRADKQGLGQPDSDPAGESGEEEQREAEHLRRGHGVEWLLHQEQDEPCRQ